MAKMKPPAAPAKIWGGKKGRLSIGTDKQLIGELVGGKAMESKVSKETGEQSITSSRPLEGQGKENDNKLDEVEFVLLPSPFLATDAVVWLCTSNIFLIISRRSATCPSMEDIRSSTVVLIWFISPSSRSSKASTFLAAIVPGFENSAFVFHNQQFPAAGISFPLGHIIYKISTTKEMNIKIGYEREDGMEFDNVKLKMVYEDNQEGIRNSKLSVVVRGQQVWAEDGDEASGIGERMGLATRKKNKKKTKKKDRTASLRLFRRLTDFLKNNEISKFQNVTLSEPSYHGAGHMTQSKGLTLLMK
ncbi:hypothetical protein M5K25_012914 [Dendrobium thyrsiflorum]|uniref:Uncharacterized protein n=1 Tax=Dendrobium thyrsiflorum TaxID=117978 RepID=A0ABD0UYT0_DENTH